MPLGNIELKVLTDAERTRLSYLSLLRYPQEASIVRHLSKEDFRDWLYSREPRSALIFANSPKGQKIVAYQKSKRWYHELWDSAWRKFHGNC